MGFEKPEKIRKTMVERYGVKHSMQNKDLALKNAKAHNIKQIEDEWYKLNKNDNGFYIITSNGLHFEVDKEDYEWASQYSWSVKTVKTAGSKYYYAKRHVNKKVSIYLHQEILNRKGIICDIVDHRDSCPQNNKLLNLRPADYSQNQFNQSKPVFDYPTSSKYKGVCWQKYARKWQAQIQYRNKQIYLGLFENEDDAAVAYNNAAIKYFGEFAKLNEFGEK